MELLCGLQEMSNFNTAPKHLNRFMNTVAAVIKGRPSELQMVVSVF